MLGMVDRKDRSKNPLVGFPVTAHKPRPVYGKDHVQILDTDIVQNLVIGPLQEG